MEILPQVIGNSIIAGSIYMLVTIGFNLIFSTTRFFDVGYGALTVVGGYAVLYFYKQLGLDIAVSIALGLIVSAIVGYLAYRFVY